jgi:hypothetical protein
LYLRLFFTPLSSSPKLIAMPPNLKALHQIHPGLRTARALTRPHAPEEASRASSIRPLDELLQGGLRLGGLIEIVGRRSSGRFSILLQTLAAFTGRGETAALVDLGDGLDPRAAGDSGVDPSRLLWARPEHLKSALVATELLLNAGFPLVALDLGSPPIPGGRGPEASWIRLARTAQKRQAVLLVSSPYRASGTTAQIIVESSKTGSRWQGAGRAPRLLSAVSTRLRLLKAIGRGPAPPQTLDWRSRTCSG